MSGVSDGGVAKGKRKTEGTCLDELGTGFLLEGQKSEKVGILQEQKSRGAGELLKRVLGLCLQFCDAVIKLKMRGDLQNQSNIYEEQQRETVQVYLRNTKKQARLIELQTPAKHSDLTIIASTRFNIPEKRVILFYNGFRIDNYHLPINLAEKGIIHILDWRNIEGSLITVSFKPISWKLNSLKATLSPQMTVREVVTGHLVPYLNVAQQRFFIVYLGKTLNLSNTLQQQFLQDGAELVVVQHKNSKEAFQKQAFEFSASYHLDDKGQSTVKNDCPVTYVTSIDGLKKKNQQQAAFIQNQNLPKAGPKPFPLPIFPVLNDSLLFGNNIPSNINISAITVPPEPVSPALQPAPSNPPSKKSSEVERVAPQPQDKSDSKIKIYKTAVDVAPGQKEKLKEYKAILELQSNYKIKQPGNESGGAFAFPWQLSQKDETDSFFNAKPAQPTK